MLSNKKYSNVTQAAPKLLSMFQSISFVTHFFLFCLNAQSCHFMVHHSQDYKMSFQDSNIYDTATTAIGDEEAIWSSLQSEF